MHYKNLTQERVNERLSRFKPNDFRSRSLPLTEGQLALRNIKRLISVAVVVGAAFAIAVSALAQMAVRS